MDMSENTMRHRTYPDGFKGPFHVYIRAAKDQPLKHIQLSKHLFGQFGKEDIGKITQMNNHKLRVEFLNAKSANSLVSDDDSNLAPYRVYIPAEQVEVEGIIRLSVGESESDLLTFGRGQFGEQGISEVRIIEVFRFQKVVRDDSGNATGRAPTPLVRVTFPGNLLPRRVVLDGLLIPVEPYKRKAMFCENCLRIASELGTPKSSVL